MQFINEEQVQTVLNWDDSFKAVERALLAVSTGHAFMPSRTITKVGNTGNAVMTMSGFLEDDQYSSLALKVLSIFPENPSKIPPLERDTYYFMLLDTENGSLKAVISGANLILFRTVAASAVATKYLHSQNNDVLAIVGTGKMGRLHAEAFQHLFKFKEVRFWNRTLERAQKVIDEFKARSDITGTFVLCDSVEKCVQNADVIVTATPAQEVLVKSIWLKKGVHLNAIGINPELQELDDDTYRSASIYVDNMESAKQQLARLLNIGAKFKSQVGDVISGSSDKPTPGTTTVFQSLGMAVEDCAVARLVYDKLPKPCKHSCRKY